MYSTQLKRALLEKELTAAKLAEITGLSRASISQYLAGKNTPKAATKQLIADALDYPLEFFDAEEELKISSINLSVATAAKLMGVCQQFIRVGLQRGVLPFGYAVKQSSKYTYYISPVKFSEHTGVVLEKL